MATWWHARESLTQRGHTILVGVFLEGGRDGWALAALILDDKGGKLGKTGPGEYCERLSWEWQWRMRLSDTGIRRNARENLIKRSRKTFAGVFLEGVCEDWDWVVLVLRDRSWWLEPRHQAGSEIESIYSLHFAVTLLELSVSRNSTMYYQTNNYFSLHSQPCRLYWTNQRCNIKLSKPCGGLINSRNWKYITLVHFS